ERAAVLQREAGGDGAVPGIGVTLRGRLAVLQKHLRDPAVVEAGKARDVVQPMQLKREGLAASAGAEAAPGGHVAVRQGPGRFCSPSASAALRWRRASTWPPVSAAWRPSTRHS